MMYLWLLYPMVGLLVGYEWAESERRGWYSFSRADYIMHFAMSVPFWPISLIIWFMTSDWANKDINRRR